MADRAIELLNGFLGIFNVEEGEYLNLVGDSNRATGVLSGEVKINDINTGAISNALEFTRRLKGFIIEQLDITKAKSVYLDDLIQNYYGISRISGESDADYSARAISSIFKIKQSPLSIIMALSPYADNVEIEEAVDDGAFSEVSFANNYRDFNLVGQLKVKAALAGEGAPLYYFFRVILTNPDPNYFMTIASIIQDFKAAGIGYDIIIE